MIHPDLCPFRLRSDSPASETYLDTRDGLILRVVKDKGIVGNKAGRNRIIAMTPSDGAEELRNFRWRKQGSFRVDDSGLELHPGQNHCRSLFIIRPGIGPHFCKWDPGPGRAGNRTRCEQEENQKQRQKRAFHMRGMEALSSVFPVVSSDIERVGISLYPAGRGIWAGSRF